MLNEERICVMTQMASYEEKQGKEDIPVKQYYRKDYVSFQMMKTFLSSTISFGILFLFWLMYNMEDITQKMTDMDPIKLGISVLICYAVFIIIYQIIAVIVYNRRYSKATAGVKKYHADIRKVIKLQEKEEKLQSAEEWE